MVSNYSAMIIGVIAGIVVVLVIEVMDKKFHIDDPVGATGVHWACGILGTFLTGVFAKSSYLEEIGMSRLQFTGVQLLGIVAVAAYALVVGFIIFKVIDVTVGLRAAESDEVEGLDVTEHGVSAYADFSLKLH